MEDNKKTQPEVQDLEPKTDAKGGHGHGRNNIDRNHGGLGTSNQ